MKLKQNCILSVYCFLLVILCTIISGQNEENYQNREQNLEGRGFLDWVGLGTSSNTDPYLASMNSQCLNGDFAECFKSRALSSLDDFFDQPTYTLTEHVKLRRMPETQLRQLAQEPFEYTETPRTDVPEWDEFVKFLMRKVEKFLKSTAFEVNIDDQISEQGRYSPRFVDEIAGEIDIIEDKKDSLFKRKQLKRLFIPLLIILKLFKLKLLLFLPLILGLASFKKFLGFLAIAIPGLFAFFKLCKPHFQSNFGHGNYYNGVNHYGPHGIEYQHYIRDSPLPNFPYHNYDGIPHSSGSGGGGGIHFGDDNHAQHLAYNGWNHYRSNSGADIKSDNDNGATSLKKSILPDS